MVCIVWGSLLMLQRILVGTGYTAIEMTTEELSTSAAVAEHEAGRMDRAEAIYRGRLAADPKDLAALIGLGDVLTDTQRFPEAEQFYRQAIALEPDAPAAAGAYDGLAAVLQDNGDLDGAIQASKKAAVLRGSAEDSYGVGNTLEFLGRITDAIEMYKLAAMQKEGFGDAHAKAAKHLLNLGLPAEAVPHYQAAARAMPNIAELHCNLGNAQQQAGDLNGALNSLRTAIEIKPELSEAHNLMGVLWQERRRWADSLASFGRALQLKPDSADVINNIGVVLEMLGRENEATQYFERAAQLRPEMKQYHLNLGSNLLMRGEFRRGWEELEWRRMDPVSSAGRMFPQPMWDGSALRGKTILIHAENPRGQTIQFLRYVKMVADLGGRVLLECQETLVPLARHMEGVAQMVVQGEPIPHFDVHCPIVSLAKVFGTTLETVPANVPYIRAEPEQVEKFAQNLPERKGDLHQGGLRVGIAWADPVKGVKTRDRACTLEKLIPLVSVPGLQLFNLQHLETPLPAELNAVDLFPKPKDLDETAGLIEHMDVVIGIESATVHLAAAMGKKTLLMLPSTPDWRWMVKREDSPWYPTMKLFRQSPDKSWAAVVEDVKQALLNDAARSSAVKLS